MTNETCTVVIDYIDDNGDRTLDNVQCDNRADAQTLIDRMLADPTVKHAYID